MLTDEDYSFLDEGESTTRGLLKGTMNIYGRRLRFGKAPGEGKSERTYGLEYLPLKIQKGGMKGREHIVLISVFAYVGLLIPVGLYVLSLLSPGLRAALRFT